MKKSDKTSALVTAVMLFLASITLMPVLSAQRVALPAQQTLTRYK